MALDQEVRAAILTPAIFARLGAHWALLAVADDRDPGRANAARDEVVHRRLRTPVGQRHVVLGGPALIGVSLDEQLELGVRSQRLRVRIEDLGVLGSDLVPVEFETNVLELRRRRELPRLARN